MLPEFNKRGYLPPGRYQTTMDGAAELLVRSDLFAESATRTQIWTGFETYLSRFVALEDRFPELLDGQKLIHCIWLGGSFTSSKVDPSNMDATLFMNPAAERAIRGNPGSKWLTTAFKSWTAMENRFGVAPHRIPYRVVASIMKPDQLPLEDLEYFRDRGRWDDWWQRCRTIGKENDEPSLESAKHVRGYLEVTL